MSDPKSFDENPAPTFPAGPIANLAYQMALEMWKATHERGPDKHDKAEFLALVRDCLETFRISE